MQPRTTLRLVLPLMGVGSACGPPLPEFSLIEYARPLAMRIDGVESPGDGGPTHAEGFPFDTMRMTPFLVDPHGPLSPQTIAAEVEPRWYACNLGPGQGIGSCLLGELPMDPADVPDCPVPDLSDLDLDSGELPEAVSPCRIVMGAPEAPEYTIPFDFNFLIGGDVEITMMGGTPGQNPSRCETGYFQRRNDTPESCIFVTQRISVGPDTELQRFAQDFGLDISDTMLPEEPEETDRNVDIVGARVTIMDENGDEIGERSVAEGERITAPLGAELEVTITFPAEQLQTYLVPIDTDEGVREYDVREEKATGSWFRTWGQLAGEGTQNAVAVNRWRLEGDSDQGEEPEDARARLFYVVRDDRIGVDWFWFEVEVTAR